MIIKNNIPILNLMSKTSITAPSFGAKLKSQPSCDVVELSKKDHTKENLINEIKTTASKTTIDIPNPYNSKETIKKYKSTNYISKEILNKLKDYEKKGIVLNKEELIALFSDLEKLANKNTNKFSNQDPLHNELTSKMYRVFVMLINKTPQKEGETTSKYFSRIIKLRESRVKQLEKFRIENIKEKLNYSPDKQIEPRKIDEIALKRLILKLNKEIEIENEYIEEKLEALDFSSPIEDIIKILQHELFFGNQGLLDSVVYGDTCKALIERFGRYNSNEEQNNSYSSYETKPEKDYKQEFEIEPVYRWLEFEMPQEEFINELPHNGDIYTYKNLQSCSTNKKYAEIDIGDHNPNFNVKLTIHPKSPTSKAYNLGHNNEVVYLPNEKFKVIDKELVEFIDPKTKTCDCRWEIHMQEV